MAALIRLPLNFIRSENAVATFEAAIVVPFILILGLGTVEFGWMMAQIQSVQVSLRDAALHAARGRLILSSAESASLSPAVTATATTMLEETYRKNGITSWSFDIALNASENGGGLYRGGSSVYSLSATTTFTPANVGLLTLFNITLPSVNLHYEVRHVGS